MSDDSLRDLDSLLIYLLCQVGFVFVILLTMAISQLYWDLKTRYPPKTTASALLVHLPFSLWHAYSVFLVVLTGFTAFGKDKYHHNAGIVTKIVGVIALVFLTSTSVGYAFHSSKGDIAGAAVIAYELLAIYQSECGKYFVLPAQSLLMRWRLQTNHTLSLSTGLLSLVSSSRCLPS